MSDLLLDALLFGSALYLSVGAIFAIAFAAAGVRKIDSHAEHCTWGFRLLLLPGASMLWPLLWWRWVGAISRPSARGRAPL